jgi:hypothetical protein
VAGSNPAVRQDVLERLEPGVIVQGSTLGDIRDQLGIAPEDVSNTQFSKAVRSLHFNYGVVTYGREGIGGAYQQSRGHYICLRQPTHG